MNKREYSKYVFAHKNQYQNFDYNNKFKSKYIKIWK